MFFRDISILLQPVWQLQVYFWHFGLAENRLHIEGKFSTLTKTEIKKQMLNLALIATGIQFIFGPLLFLTLPGKGVSWGLFWVIMGGVTVVIIVMFQLWKLLHEDKNPGKRFYIVIGYVYFTCCIYGDRQALVPRKCFENPQANGGRTHCRTLGSGEKSARKPVNAASGNYRR